MLHNARIAITAAISTILSLGKAFRKIPRMSLLPSATMGWVILDASH